MELSAGAWCKLWRVIKWFKSWTWKCRDQKVVKISHNSEKGPCREVWRRKHKAILLIDGGQREGVRA